MEGGVVGQFGRNVTRHVEMVGDIGNDIATNLVHFTVEWHVQHGMVDGIYTNRWLKIVKALDVQVLDLVH